MESIRNGGYSSFICRTLCISGAPKKDYNIQESETGFPLFFGNPSYRDSSQLKLSEVRCFVCRRGRHPDCVPALRCDGCRV